MMTVSPATRLFAGIAGAAILLGVAACRSSTPPPQPVSGKVLFQGKGVEGAVVTFHPVADTDANPRRFSAITTQDGTFRLSADGAFDGAPAGEYAVTVFYLSPEKKADGQNAGPDLLKGRYADPKTTMLKAEIKPGVNELAPFRLP
jgi:hypothetical protein